MRAQPTHSPPAPGALLTLAADPDHLPLCPPAKGAHATLAYPFQNLPQPTETCHPSHAGAKRTHPPPLPKVCHISKRTHRPCHTLPVPSVSPCLCGTFSCAPAQNEPTPLTPRTPMTTTFPPPAGYPFSKEPNA